MKLKSNRYDLEIEEQNIGKLVELCNLYIQGKSEYIKVNDSKEVVEWAEELKRIILKEIERR